MDETGIACEIDAAGLAASPRLALDAARGGGVVVRDVDGARLALVPAPRLAALAAIAAAAATAAGLERALETGGPLDLGAWWWLRGADEETLRAVLRDVRDAVIASHATADAAPLARALAGWRATLAAARADEASAAAGLGWEETGWAQTATSAAGREELGWEVPTSAAGWTEPEWAEPASAAGWTEPASAAEGTETDERAPEGGGAADEAGDAGESGWGTGTP